MCGGEHLTTRKGQKKSASCRRNIGKNIRKTRRHTIKINQVYNKIEAECERSGCKVKKCNWQRNLGTKKHRDGVENGKGGGHIGAEGEGQEEEVALPLCTITWADVLRYERLLTFEKWKPSPRSKVRGNKTVGITKWKAACSGVSCCGSFFNIASRGAMTSARFLGWSTSQKSDLLKLLSLKRTPQPIVIQKALK